jgi:hypothetical protein
LTKNEFLLKIVIMIQGRHFKSSFFIIYQAEVVKLVDTPALGAGGATRGGSSPLFGTLKIKKILSNIKSYGRKK